MSYEIVRIDPNGDERVLGVHRYDFDAAIQGQEAAKSLFHSLGGRLYGWVLSVPLGKNCSVFSESNVEEIYRFEVRKKEDELCKS